MTVLILAITLVAATTATPIDSEKREALRFLRAYVFLKDDGGSLSSGNATSLRHVLSLYQVYYQLSGNGALNPDTHRLMRKPRCGLADIPGRAYSPIARKWPKTRLTWNFQVASEELLRTAEATFALDAALIMNRRLYIANRRNVWSVEITERRYRRPMKLTDYATYLPANLTRLSATYRRPSGDLALFVNDSIYVEEFPSFKLKLGWPRSLHDIGLPRDAKINAAIKTHTGRTYAIYDDDKVAEIDECRMIAVRHAPLKDIFPGIPPAITSAYRHIDDNLYFFAKRQFYAFNEFTNIVTLAGPFDLHVLGIECPTDGLLRQLRDLLIRAYHLGDVTESDEIDEEDD
ncbi:collagenase 3-like [Formica exsecta]|uniref:collagenase 3-like n=1 Tax=Formica exsecta TaxID=72781 RepID=UPI001141E7CA|nr:collagenase 3-like [Formica exsecta]